MSDTPETDAAWAAWQYAGPGVHANFARKLERERDEARKSLEFQTKLSKEVIEREKQTHKECDELCAEVERLKADKERLERALRQARDCFWEIENTRWGYDGDCGVVAIANEGSDLIQSAMKGAE